MVIKLYDKVIILVIFKRCDSIVEIYIKSIYCSEMNARLKKIVQPGIYLQESIWFGQEQCLYSKKYHLFKGKTMKQKKILLKKTLSSIEERGGFSLILIRELCYVWDVTFSVFSKCRLYYYFYLFVTPAIMNDYGIEISAKKYNSYTHIFCDFIHIL